jgi:hypothetical protein
MLKKRGYEVLTAGVEHNEPDTLNTLCDWADIIFVAQREYASLLPGFGHKVNFKFAVGIDDWDISDHPDLIRIYRKILGDPT